MRKNQTVRIQRRNKDWKKLSLEKVEEENCSKVN